MEDSQKKTSLKDVLRQIFSWETLHKIFSWPLLGSVVSGVIVLIIQYRYFEATSLPSTPTAVSTPTPITATISPQEVSPTSTSMPTSALAINGSSFILAPTPSAPRFIVEAASVNLRAGPGKAYDSLGAADVGDEFTIVAKSPYDEWWQVCCLEDTDIDTNVWVYGPLGDAENAENVPVADSIPPPPSPTSTKMPDRGDKLAILDPEDGAVLPNSIYVQLKWEEISGGLGPKEYYDIKLFPDSVSEFKNWIGTFDPYFYHKVPECGRRIYWSVQVASLKVNVREVIPYKDRTYFNYFTQSDIFDKFINQESERRSFIVLCK